MSDSDIKYRANLIVQRIKFNMITASSTWHQSPNAHFCPQVYESNSRSREYPHMTWKQSSPKFNTFETVIIKLNLYHSLAKYSQVSLGHLQRRYTSWGIRTDDIGMYVLWLSRKWKFVSNFQTDSTFSLHAIATQGIGTINPAIIFSKRFIWYYY